MGAWGELAFDNDSANDWAYGLDETDDLSLVESAFDELEDSSLCNRLRDYMDVISKITAQVGILRAARSFAPRLARLKNATMAFVQRGEHGQEYLEEDPACNALAACEVLARLQGNHGYKNAYTEKVDDWVAAHKIRPTPELLNRASAAVDRILGDNSELRDLWDETEDRDKWQTALADLRLRLRA